MTVTARRRREKFGAFAISKARFQWKSRGFCGLPPVGLLPPRPCHTSAALEHRVKEMTDRKMPFLSRIRIMATMAWVDAVTAVPERSERRGPERVPGTFRTALSERSRELSWRHPHHPSSLHAHRGRVISSLRAAVIRVEASGTPAHRHHWRAALQQSTASFKRQRSSPRSSACGWGVREREVFYPKERKGHERNEKGHTEFLLSVPLRLHPIGWRGFRTFLLCVRSS